jgi:hypothetical protein
MMKQVTPFHTLKPSILKIVKMRAEMHEVIHHVAENESSKEACCKTTILKHSEKAPIKQKRQAQVNCRWHYQTKRIVRIIVMNSVSYVVNFLTQFGCEFFMKEIPVNAVLNQRPKEISREKQTCN